jgi:hypothetical protein
MQTLKRLEAQLIVAAVYLSKDGMGKRATLQVRILPPNGSRRRLTIVKACARGMSRGGQDHLRCVTRRRLSIFRYGAIGGCLENCFISPMFIAQACAERHQI